MLGLCAFNQNHVQTAHPRLEKCRSTCDARLQSAALESHVPSSLSPSAVDSIFLRHGVDSQSTFQEGRVDQPSSSSSGPGGQSTNNLRPMQTAASAGRPRRLPTLIKILTGFDDAEASGNKNAVIARIERPQFAQQKKHQVNSKRRRTSSEPLSHEETVQIAAAAAAAAVFSKSIRIFGNNRMSRVNSEWDAALRWIAGWDQQQQMAKSEPPIGRRAGSSSSTSNGGLSNDASQQGYDNFVDDLARMLETCITQCVGDEQFEARFERDNAGPGQDISMGGSSIISLVLRSIFGWAGSSFPRLTFSETSLMIVRTLRQWWRSLQFFATVYILRTIHSLWVWASPTISEWYVSLKYNESPEWLIEHENELKLATKNSRTKQKKKKRKQSNRLSGKSKSSSNNNEMPKESVVDKGTSDHKPVQTAPQSDNASRPASAEHHAITSDSQAALQSTAKQVEPCSKDAESCSQESTSTSGIPSIISYTTTSATSSPSIKPIGNHLEGRVTPFGGSLQGPPQPALRLSSPLGHKGPLLSQSENKFTVPTQEQRNEAAKQLREFQNAQIQRLLLQRKLSQQSSNVNRPPAAPSTSSGLLPGSSFQSTTSNASTESSVKPNKVLKPPPGLPHPSENIPFNPDEHLQDDKGFLTDNEVFLTKLLDDEDDDVVVPSMAPSSAPLGIESMSPPSSLDPSAAPFVASAPVDESKMIAKETKEKAADAWQSNPSDLLKEASPMGIKGVYGGSVW